MAEKIKSNKKGQVTIWVILALVLAGTAILFFIFEKKPLGISESASSPEQYIEKCVGEAVIEATEIILPQGGFVEPADYKLYNNTKVTYLCKSRARFVQCINEHPMLLNEINNEIKNYIAPRVENCFESMKKNFEDRGISVQIAASPLNFSVSMAPEAIFTKIFREINLNERGIIKSFREFETKTNNPAYSLINIANNIANHEREFCYFEYVGYMAVDRSVGITKTAMSDATKIYSITDKDSGKTMNIATKSCVIME